MTKQILLDNTLVGWSEFADGLLRFRQMVQADAAYAYIVTAPGLRDRTTALCRYLETEDYTYVLGPGGASAREYSPWRHAGSVRRSH